MRLSEIRIRQIIRETLSEALLPQMRPPLPGESFEDEDEDEDEGMPSADQPPSRIKKRMEKRAAKVASRSSRRGASIGDALDRIHFFTSDQGRMMWMQGARNEYEDMAGGGDGGGIRGEYYPGWRDGDFQYVIDAVESGGM